MVVRKCEKFVATRSVAGPPGKIFCWRCWALALARPCRVRSRPWTLVAALPIALALLAALLSAVLGVAIALAGVPTPPAACLVATGCGAIARLRLRRPEQTRAAFEQTTPEPTLRALWPLAAVPDKMTMVHGRW